MAACLCALVSAAGCTSEAQVIVQLQTDLVAGLEFNSVDVALLAGPPASGAGVRRQVNVSAEHGMAFLEPMAVAELERVTAGTAYIRVRLSLDGAPVAERYIAVTVRSSIVVTAIIPRTCRDVRCDADQTCVDARCANPMCTPETPEHCPPSLCEEGGTCVATTSCVRPRCADGVCLLEPTGECGSERWCDPDRGCRDLEPEPDAGVPDAGCASSREELCNEVDDDCDGLVDEGLSVVSDPSACGGLPLEGETEITGTTWDRAWVVRAARVFVGSPAAAIICCQAPVFGTGVTGLPMERSVGVLLGTDGSDGFAHSGRFPGVGETPGANVDRVGFELDWGSGQVLVNGAGPDLAIYEIATPEALTLSVHRPAGWSPRRYAFPSAVDAVHDVSVTLFDLSEFGLVEGESVDMLHVESVFNTDAVSGEDRVDDVTGEGATLRAGEDGYASAHPLLDAAGGATYPSAQLDTDVLWVVALHPITPPDCCVR